MTSDSSSFDDIQNTPPLTSSFSDIVPVEKSGATSDCFKVRIYAKWHFLKRPKKAFSTNPIYIAAFEKEFDLGFTIDHPNIVRYISKGSDKEGIFILTEFIDGFTLNEFIERNPEFFKNKQNVNKILLQLLSSLEYIHAKQIVHLDIKPENILITTNGNNLKLIDLGLSYSDCYTEITGGTQSFGSPEQFSKQQLIDYRSDLYAFGKIVLYIFTGNTQKSLTERLPAPFKRIVKECLIEDVNRRNIKTEECVQLINQRNRTPILFVIVALILLLFILIWFFWIKAFQPSTKEQKVFKPDSISVNQNSKNKTIERYKGEVNSIMIKPILRRVNNLSNNSIESIVRMDIKKRLQPNKSALLTTYSDINEFNVAVLKKSFDDWKKQCTDDCQRLYGEYHSQISFDKFKVIYNSELDKINSPIQKRLDEFSKR